MALNTAEIKILKEAWEYYSHRADDDELAAEKIAIILDGTEEEKKTLIANFLEDHLLPKYNSSKNSHENELVKVNRLIDRAEAYIAANS